MNKQKVLITGSKGQLGIELLRSIPGDFEATGVDIDELDICDPQAVRKTVEGLKPDVIINCAAYTAVDKAESDAKTAFRVNRDGPRNLAEAAAQTGALIVQISTDFVFDGKKSSPYLPDDPPNPLNVYGQSKLEGEQAVIRTAGASALIVRTAWLYSAHGNNFLKTMLRLMKDRPEIGVVADQVGTPTSADSLASALWCLLDKNPPSGTYHYTDAGVASWYDFACAIRRFAPSKGLKLKALVLPIQTKAYPTAAKRPAYSVLEKSKTTNIINAPIHWEDTLNIVMDHEIMKFNHN